jgi:hypothetical protein
MLGGGVIKHLWSVFHSSDLKEKCNSYLYSLGESEVKDGGNNSSNTHENRENDEKVVGQGFPCKHEFTMGPWHSSLNFTYLFGSVGIMMKCVNMAGGRERWTFFFFFKNRKQ